MRATPGLINHRVLAPGDEPITPAAFKKVYQRRAHAYRKSPDDQAEAFLMQHLERYAWPDETKRIVARMVLFGSGMAGVDTDGWDEANDCPDVAAERGADLATARRTLRHAQEEAAASAARVAAAEAALAALSAQA